MRRLYGYSLLLCGIGTAVMFQQTANIPPGGWDVGRGWGGGGVVRLGFKELLQPANFTLGPDAILNTEIHKNSLRTKAPNSPQCFLPSFKSIGLSFQEKKRNIFKMAAILDCRSE